MRMNVAEQTGRVRVQCVSPKGGERLPRGPQDNVPVFLEVASQNAFFWWKPQWKPAPENHNF